MLLTFAIKQKHVLLSCRANVHNLVAFHSCLCSCGREWKDEFGKSYRDEAEELHRRSVFEENRKIVKHWNNRAVEE